MEVLKNFVTEKTHESENASHEIHDVDTRKVNQEWRNSNFGLKTNHVPKIDMRKFDGKDPITWILHMEQFEPLLPLIMGRDVSGEVTTIGSAIRQLHLQRN
jgi:hypothetical protein